VGFKQIGRQAHMRGDGTLELTNVGAANIPRPPITSEDSISNFSIQNFPEIEAVSWDRSSTLTKLITIATVCNKAKFVFTDDNSGEDVQFGACKGTRGSQLHSIADASASFGSS
jgi:hypothetical protein